jgi:hypothetical protein
MNRNNRSVKNLILPGLMMLSFALACQKTEPLVESGSFEYLIFGHFYGKCVGEECIELFRLEPQQLSEDQLDQYPSRDKAYEGNFAALSSEKFNLVKDLNDFFPLALLDEDKTVFGCPDCADQGGLYLEHSLDGQTQYWIIDNNKAEIPNYLHGFVDMVHQKIMLINS